MNFSYYVNEHKLQCEEKSPFFQKRTMVPLFLQDLPKTHTYVFHTTKAVAMIASNQNFPYY